MNAAGRAFLLFLLVVSVAFACLVVREMHLGAAAMRESDDKLGGGDVVGAIEAATDAAEARAPGSPYPELGYARLAAIAREAEEKDDVTTALAAWRAVRVASAASETWARRTERVEQADEAVARLSTQGRTGAAALRDPDVERAAMMAALSRDDRPTALSFAWLAAGAVVFFAGAARLAMLPGSATRKQIALGAVVPAAGLCTAILACAFH